MRFPFASIAILAALATAEPEPKPTSDIEPTSSIGHTEKHLSLREEYKTLTGHMKEKRDDVRNTCGVVVDKDTQLGGLWQTPTEPKECRLLRAKPFKFFEMLSGCRSCELWK